MFSIFYQNEKRMEALKIQSKNLLNKKMVVNYLNFVFLNEVKTNSKYWILNFVFQYIKNTKRHFGYMDFRVPKVPSRVFDKMKNGIQIFILRFCFYFNMRNEIEIMTTILIINRFLLWILMTSFVFHFHKKMENEIGSFFIFHFHEEIEKRIT